MLRRDAARLGRLEVAGELQAAAALVRHQPLRLRRVLVLAEVGDRHVGALARKVDGHGAADAAVAACARPRAWRQRERGSMCAAKRVSAIQSW